MLRALIIPAMALPVLFILAIAVGRQLRRREAGPPYRPMHARDRPARLVTRVPAFTPCMSRSPTGWVCDHHRFHAGPHEQFVHNQGPTRPPRTWTQLDWRTS